MALVKCKECGKDISEQAASCPNCGAPNGAQKKKTGGLLKWIFIIFVVLIILAVIGSVIKKDDHSNEPTSVESAQAGNIPPSQLNVIKIMLADDAQGLARGDDSLMGSAAGLVNVTSKQLYTDYKNNEVAADQVYKGRLILVSGKIETIAKDFMDKPYVELYGNGFLESSQASFARGVSEQKIAELIKGQNVVLVCRGAGKILLSPMLKDCQFAVDYASDQEAKTISEILNASASGGKVSQLALGVEAISGVISRHLGEDTKCNQVSSACLEEAKKIMSNASSKQEVKDEIERLKAAGWIVQ